MRYSMKSTALLIMLSLLAACMHQSRVTEGGSLGFKSRFSLSCEVVNINGNLVTVRVNKPSTEQTGEKLAIRLARGIVSKSYFLEGKETLLGSIPVKILRVLGNDLLLEALDGKPAVAVGDRHDILLEKRVIAISDFEVVRGRDKSVAAYVQEDVTTTLVNSGQFNVLERYKLATVLNELKMEQSGIMDEEQAKKVGRLLGADLILTGTLAAAGNNWNANLRLINTETGLIISAINASGPLHELKGERYRESGDISGTFDDDADLAGWIVGNHFRDRVGKGGYTKIYVDRAQGVTDSGTSLAMDFKLGEERIVANKPMVADLTNLMKRDLYSYDGIEFAIKGSRELTVIFQINEKPGSESEEESWFRTIPVTTEWKKEKVEFNTMSVNKKKAGRLKTNQRFDLDAVEAISWLIVEKQNRPGTEGTIWIDEVHFYSR